MSYRNKTYVCFDGDEDMRYYRLMTAWKAHDGFAFNFHNAHDLNAARDSSLEASIKRQLRERFANSKMLVVLIGNKTRFLRKFVQWEMETAIRLNLPIIAVNLNKNRSKDDLCPPAIQGELAVFISYGPKIMEHAMAHWPNDHLRLRSEGKTGDYIFKEDVYRRLGI